MVPEPEQEGSNNIVRTCDNQPHASIQNDGSSDYICLTTTNKNKKQKLWYYSFHEFKNNKNKKKVDGLLWEGRKEFKPALAAFLDGLLLDESSVPCKVAVGALLCERGKDHQPTLHVARSLLSDALSLVSYQHKSMVLNSTQHKELSICLLYPLVLGNINSNNLSRSYTKKIPRLTRQSTFNHHNIQLFINLNNPKLPNLFPPILPGIFFPL